MRTGFARCPKGVCRLSETDPKHRRTRCSLLVEFSGRRVLIDVSPDFRQQALREGILGIDAVLITHRHADHIGGIPDIRSYNPPDGRALDFYGSAESMDGIRQAYPYIFDPTTFVGGGIPRIATHAVGERFELFGEAISPVSVDHGALAGCFGFRIGGLAYIPDMKKMPEESLDRLRGVQCLILNCLRDAREHSTHMILPQSLALARRIGARRCCFVHMCHDIHYQTHSALLDPGMEFAHDGLRITV